MDLQQVSLLKVVEPLEHDAALGAGVHLVNFFTEMAEAGDSRVDDGLAVSYDSGRPVSYHSAFGHPATGDLYTAAAFEYLTYFRPADHDFREYRLKHPVQR